MHSEYTYHDERGRAWELTAYPALRKVMVVCQAYPYEAAELYGTKESIIPQWINLQAIETGKPGVIPANIRLEAEALWHEMTGGGHV
jgi:hypothetical protein